MLLMLPSRRFRTWGTTSSVLLERRSDRADIPEGWTPAVRVDIGRLRKAEKTASGGVRVPAAVSREGILEYLRADGTVVRELVPREEAARLESLQTLRDAVVTVGHPANGTRLVSPDTYKTDSVGHVSGEPSFEGGHVVASLAILDADTMRRVDSGELEEISAGYRVMIDPTPGELNGQRYDQVQRRREYNHVALLPKGGGRAGETVSLRLDGVECAVEVRPQAQPPTTPKPAEQRTDTMKTERIDGVDYEIGSASWAQAKAKHDARIQARLDELEEMEAEKAKTDSEMEKLRAENDSLKEKIDELEKKIADADSPERADALVSARFDLFRRAQRVLGADVKLDGKSELEIMRLAVAKAVPSLAARLRLDANDPNAVTEVYLRTRFEIETEEDRAPRPSPIVEARGDAFNPPPSHADPRPNEFTFGREAPPDLSTRYQR